MHLSDVFLVSSYPLSLDPGARGWVGSACVAIGLSDPTRPVADVFDTALQV